MEFDPERSAAGCTAEETTEILLRWSGGDASALEELTPRVYTELRRLARGYADRSNTLEPTALVHELFIRLIKAERVDVRSRAHFLAVAAKAMRRIVIDAARASVAAKRDAGLRVDLTGLELAEASPNAAIIRLNEALSRLELADPRKASVVELRFFAGLEMSEVAEALEISLATAERDWRFARAWLYKTLAEESP